MLQHEKVLYEWLRHRHSEGVPIFIPMLMENAIQFHDEISILLLTPLQATEYSSLP